MNALGRSVTRLLSALLVLVLLLVLFTLAKGLGWLSPLGIKSETHDSQVIQAIERTQEVSLLSLGIQGITEKDRCSTVFGKCVPGTGQKVFIQYNFNAKLGIDGSQVEVTKTGKSRFRITVPKYVFIGYDQPTFKVAVADGGVLSFVTSDIDRVEMVNEILNSSARDGYIAKNEDLLQDQTKVFYDTLITSIDSEAKTTYEFQ